MKKEDEEDINKWERLLEKVVTVQKNEEKNKVFSKSEKDDGYVARPSHPELNLMEDMEYKEVLNRLTKEEIIDRHIIKINQMVQDRKMLLFWWVVSVVFFLLALWGALS